MKLADKTKIYQKLVSGLSKGVQLAALLGEQGHTAKQAEVLAKNLGGHPKAAIDGRLKTGQRRRCPGR